MKYIYSLFLLLAFTVACEQKTISGKELEDKLKETMTDYLDETLKYGTVFVIKDMNYYADNIKNHYICTFDVSVRTGNRDTIGVMKAIISRDFSKVNRTQ